MPLKSSSAHNTAVLLAYRCTAWWHIKQAFYNSNDELLLPGCPQVHSMVADLNLLKEFFQGATAAEIIW
jgi:hypothetical protein